MIARENLESRKQKLANHIGVLGLEKLDCIEKADRVSEEMRQSAVLLRVFEATLADLEKDGVDITELYGKIGVMEKRIRSQESQLDAYSRARGFDGDLPTMDIPTGNVVEADKETE